jgi:hydroxymethylglutaryl-CoA reductase
VIDDRMQRAPAFIFRSAREAPDFGHWLTEHLDEIRAAAEQTTRTGRLQDIEQYPASRILFWFNYTTGSVRRAVARLRRGRPRSGSTRTTCMDATVSC